MNAHLKAIPRLGPFTTGRLTGSHLQDFCRESHWALDAEVLGLCATNEVRGDYSLPLRISALPLSLSLKHQWKKVVGGVGAHTFLESLHLFGSKCDADAVDFRPSVPELALLWLVVRHREEGTKRLPFEKKKIR